jgi:excisionase family DNA binding protein
MPRPSSPVNPPRDTGPHAPITVVYTPAEAAQLLKVRESWLRRRAAARQVPCTFLGKHLRFSADDITAIIAAGTQPVTNRRPRHRPPAAPRGRDLPSPPDRSVHAHVNDPDPHGSSSWHG